MTEFSRRQIGPTGLRITELGLGCATLGGSQIAVARATAEEIVGAAWAVGCATSMPRRTTGSARPSVASAMRCATAHGASVCYRPRSADCCARTRLGSSRTAAATRCRSTLCTITRMTGSCARSRTVFSGSGWPLAAAVLQFPLAHPAVAAIIPGPRNAEEFVANLDLPRHPIPAALWADLRQAGLLHPNAPVPHQIEQGGLTESR
jgi:aryl-alcohol dehydrogenase-like predicted oxidoreductase